MLTSEWPSDAILRQALTQMGLDFSPSEWQGVLLGLIAVHPGATETTYADALAAEFGTPTPESEPLVQLCIHLASQTLTAGEMDLPLLLPSEESIALESRVQALSAWCHGFLYGVSLNASMLDHPDVQQILSDVCKIAEVGLEEDSDLASQEAAFEELVEYARMLPYFVFMTCALPTTVSP